MKMISTNSIQLCAMSNFFLGMEGFRGTSNFYILVFSSMKEISSIFFKVEITTQAKHPPSKWHLATVSLFHPKKFDNLPDSSLARHIIPKFAFLCFL